MGRLVTCGLIPNLYTWRALVLGFGPALLTPLNFSVLAPQSLLQHLSHAPAWRCFGYTPVSNAVAVTPGWSGQRHAGIGCPPREYQGGWEDKGPLASQGAFLPAGLLRNRTPALGRCGARHAGPAVVVLLCHPLGFVLGKFWRVSLCHPKIHSPCCLCSCGCSLKCPAELSK